MIDASLVQVNRVHDGANEFISGPDALEMVQLFKADPQG